MRPNLFLMTIVTLNVPQIGIVIMIRTAGDLSHHRKILLVFFRRIFTFSNPFALSSIKGSSHKVHVLRVFKGTSTIIVTTRKSEIEIEAGSETGIMIMNVGEGIKIVNEETETMTDELKGIRDVMKQ